MTTVIVRPDWVAHLLLGLIGLAIFMNTAQAIFSDYFAARREDETNRLLAGLVAQGSAAQQADGRETGS